MNTKPLQGINGFTLIEILIATVIITIVSLGAASLTIGIIHGNSFSKRLTTAITLVQDQLEDVKRLGYANVGTIGWTDGYGDIEDFTGYKRVVTITPDNPEVNMKTIKVAVFWDADKYSMQATTILSQ